MNKEQSADDPSMDLIRIKNMLNSTIPMSFTTNVAIAYLSGAPRCLWKHSNN